MHKRDHNWEDDFHFEGEGYVMVLRKPGAHRIIVPAGFNYLDVYLGRSMATYKIAGRETVTSNTPPSTFVFLPANGESEIQAVRSGWSVQMIFRNSELTNVLATVSDPAERAQNTVLRRPIYHDEDPSLVGIAQVVSSVWTKRIAAPNADQIDAAAKLMVMRLVHNLSVNDPGTATRATRNASRFQTVLDHIDENLSERMSLDELAALANLSSYHFARVFRETMGHSPHQYIKLQRVAVAKQMLKRSDEPIAAIAYDCGFSSQSHMTDVFKKTIGTTPGIVRKNRE
ncbi:MAG: AraC family transcriptional regulator [Pseudomonadota bacterium]